MTDSRSQSPAQAQAQLPAALALDQMMATAAAKAKYKARISSPLLRMLATSSSPATSKPLPSSSSSLSQPPQSQSQMVTQAQSFTPPTETIDLTLDEEEDDDIFMSEPQLTKSTRRQDADIETETVLLSTLAALSPSSHLPTISTTDARALLKRANGCVQTAANMFLDGQLVPSSSSSAFSSNHDRVTRPLKRPVSDDSFLPEPTVLMLSETAPDAMPRRYLIGELTTTAFAVSSGVQVSAGTTYELDVQGPASPPSRKKARTGAAATYFASTSSATSSASTPAKLPFVRFSCPRTGSALGRIGRAEAAWLGPLISSGLVFAQASVIFAAPSLRLGDEIIVSIALNLDTLKVTQLNRSSSSDASAVWSEIREPLCGMLAALAIVPRRAGMPTTLSPDIWSSLRGLSTGSNDASTSEDTSTDVADSPDGDAANPNAQPDHALLASLFSTSQTSIETIPHHPTPKSMVYELRPYQEQALHWMLQKETQTIGGDSGHEDTCSAAMHPLFFELPLAASGPPSVSSSWYVNPFDGAIKLKFPPVESHARGGILADEMGLGKTIEVCALIHANPPSSTSTITTTKVYPATLVVCPMSLLAQWSSELMAASQDKSIQVFEYYGPNRTLPSLFLTGSSTRSRSGTSTTDKLTVIVTTYGVVMSEFNSSTGAGGSRPLFDCEFHRIVLDEAHSIRNTSASTTRACWALRASLRWALTGTPIVNKLDDMYSLLAYLKYAPWSQHAFWKHHVTGPLDAERVAADGMTALRGGKGKAKVGTTSVAQEVAAAAAAAKAVETVQNLMQQLVLRRTKETKIKGESILVLPKKEVKVEVLEFSPEEKDIYRALEKHTRTKFSHYVKAGTVLSNYTHILALISSLRQCCDHPSLLFKSSSTDVSSSNALPSSQDGQDFHTLLTRYLEGTASSASDSSSFGQSVIKSLASGTENISSSLSSGSSSLENSDTTATSECPLCLDLVSEPTLLPCFHVFCRECLLESLASMTRRGDQHQSCPVCRVRVSESDVFSVLKAESDANSLGEGGSGGGSGAAKLKVVPASARGHHIPSTKLWAILSKLRALPDGTKAVVFTQFRGMLDLIGGALGSHGIQFARLDGSQPQAKREVELKAFRTDPQVKCLIASLKACNVGLNLTAANVAILVDPWWNAAVEQQAIDRVHRIGQTKEVQVTRFVVKESVEERMVLIQEHKLALISRVTKEGTEGKEQVDAREERVRELRMLFGMDQVGGEGGR